MLARMFKNVKMSKKTSRGPLVNWSDGWSRFVQVSFPLSSWTSLQLSLIYNKTLSLKYTPKVSHSLYFLWTNLQQVFSHLLYIALIFTVPLQPKTTFLLISRQLSHSLCKLGVRCWQEKLHIFSVSFKLNVGLLCAYWNTSHPARVSAVWHYFLFSVGLSVCAVLLSIT